MKKRFCSLIASVLLVAIALGLAGCKAKSIDDQLIKIAQKERSRVELGMTAEQVRKKLGSPRYILDGVPALDEQRSFRGVVKVYYDEAPSPTGGRQSTWIYLGKEVTLREKVYPESEYTYYVNGSAVPRGVYDRYRTHNGDDFDTGVMLKPNPAKPAIREDKEVFRPTLCVTFDGSMKVVTNRTVYFLIVLPPLK